MSFYYMSMYTLQVLQFWRAYVVMCASFMVIVETSMPNKIKLKNAGIIKEELYRNLQYPVESRL